MAFPPEEPGRFYSDPIDFHEGTIYKVDGPVIGDHNHEIDFHSDASGPVRFHESHVGSGFYQEALGGPYPGGAATSCCWLHASRGHNVGGAGTEWADACPDILTTPPSTTHGAVHGSNWSAGTDASSIFNDTSSASATISGWVLRPWKIHANFDNQWMDDDDLEAEYNAALDLKPAGWFVELEAFHPIFLGYQVAPDETISGSMGLRTEGVTWLYDPTGWNFYGVDESNDGIWQTGLAPSGTELTYYDGGLVDWLDVPEAWLPTQDPDPFTCSFVEPAGGDTEGIPLTVVCDSLYPNGGLPDENGSGGRQGQTLLVRAAWRTPKLRFYREITSVPPRRIRQRSDGATHGAQRVHGGGNTVQSGNRTVGAIL